MNLTPSSSTECSRAQTTQRSDRSTFHIPSPQSVWRLVSAVYESGVSVLDGGGVGDDLKRCTGGLQNDRRCSARPNNSKYGLRAPLCDGGDLRSPYPRHTVPRRNQPSAHCAHSLSSTPPRSYVRLRF